LLITLLILLILFVITSFTVRVYHDVEKGYAQDWYVRGEDDLHSGRAEAALVDFRTALSFSHDNEQYQLRLAQVLMMPGIRKESGLEAQTYLVNLLEHQPGNAQVNLELARLAARRHAVSDALRYYHGAIYGEWSNDDPVAQRRAARLELVEFLLQSGQHDAARSELIALATDLPPNPILQTRVGTLLIQVRGYGDALKLFHLALLEKPNLPAALAGAGECHFQNGDYAQAERYLSRALDQDPQLANAAAMLDTSRMVLINDPFNHRLSNKEKARRAEIDFDTAMVRLKACGAQKGIDLSSQGNDPLQTLFAKSSEIEPIAKKHDPSRESEMVSQTMDTVFEIEQTSARICGEPSGIDYALLLIAREQGGTHP
jgi:tetratricopeptide (TPR) repeat protein